jgi:uncharacterized protein (DUF58 family)
MLTARGLWLLIWGFVITLIGVYLSYGGFGGVAILGLSLIGYVFFKVSVFLRQSHRLRNAFKIHVEVVNVWDVPQRLLRVHNEYKLVVTLENQSTSSTSWLLIQPISSSNWQSKSDNFLFLQMDAKSKKIWEIAFQCDGVGSFHFAGFQLFLTDSEGIVFQTISRLIPVELLVIPKTDSSDFERAGLKRHNVLPPPGSIRLRLPGQGSELLELRDYRPGDSPRMIAWKTSARRDRLITKELESEVPIRITLFVDAGASNRFGPFGQREVDRISEFCAALSDAALRERNFVGLVRIDEAGGSVLKPARSTIHRYRLAEHLAETGKLKVVSGSLDLEERIRQVYPLAHELYPELMNPSLNRVTWKSLWEPVLDGKHAWKVMLLLASPALLYFTNVRGFFATMAAAITASRGIEFILIFIALTAILPLIGLVLWGWFGTKWHWRKKYHQRSRRKRLAMLFATIDEARLDCVSMWMQDDAALTRRIERFLQSHQSEVLLLEEPTSSQRLQQQTMRLQRLSQAVSQAILRARDNELFVICVDLNEIEADIEVLDRTLRLARAKHHDVLVVLPWIAGVPLAGKEAKIDVKSPAAGWTELDYQLWLGKQADHYRERATLIQSQLRRTGAQIVSDHLEEAIPLFLRRISMLRGQRR